MKTNSWGRLWKKHFSLTFKKDEFLMENFLNEKVDPVSYLKELLLKDMNLIRDNNINIIFNKDIMYFSRENNKGIALIKVEKDLESNNYNATLYSTYILSENEREAILNNKYAISFSDFNDLYIKYKSSFI